MAEERTDRKVIACNYTEGIAEVSKGSLAYVVPVYLGGNLPERTVVRVRSRGGRWITKWESMRRLENFRLKTLPPEHPRWSDEELHADIPVDESKVAVLIRCKEQVTR